MSYLGRFQQGQNVTIGVSTTAAPDAAPIATIKDSSGDTIWSGGIALVAANTFSLSIFIGVVFSLGTFTVTYSWAIKGVAGTATDTFDVIGGGDPGGKVVSMYSYVRPDATYVVAQLSSGNTVQGRNPRL